MSRGHLHLGFIEESGRERLQEHWGKKWLLLKRDEVSVPEFDEDAFLDVATSPAIGYPQVHCIKNRNERVDPHSFVRSKTPLEGSFRAHPKKLRKTALEGATVRISLVSQFMPLFREIERVASLQTGSTNFGYVYYAAAPCPGLRPHYEQHHTFILQTWGSKLWGLSDRPVVDSPISGGTTLDGGELPVHHEVEIHQGEVLYMPPGTVHSVRTIDRSVHYAIHVDAPRVFHLIQDHLAAALDDVPRLRKEVPWQGADVDRETARMMIQALDDLRVLKEVVS